MPRKFILAAVAIAAGVFAPASTSLAGGIFVDVPMTRVFVCKNSDSTMEIYLPQSLLQRRNVRKSGLGRTIIGLYALDLSGAQKGKTIEAVRMRSSRDNTAIVLEQITRKRVKPATIPMSGGKLDFDPRLGAAALCEPFSVS